MEDIEPGDSSAAAEASALTDELSRRLTIKDHDQTTVRDDDA